jgi:hypothetical protein
MVQLLWKQYGISSQSTTQVTIDPAVPLLDIAPKELKAHMWAALLTAALITT